MNAIGSELLLPPIYNPKKWVARIIVMNLSLVTEVTNCEGECSFFKFTLIKNRLKSTLEDDQRSGLYQCSGLL